MKIMTVLEFTERNGITPSLAQGRWKPWDKPGFYELTSLNNQHVEPRIWDEVSGTAWVETIDRKLKYVRVENLRKYKPSKDRAKEIHSLKASGRVGKKEEIDKAKRLTQQVFKDLGIDL